MRAVIQRVTQSGVRVRGHGVRAQTGRFGAMMQVDQVNDGPVTFVMESTS